MKYRGKENDLIMDLTYWAALWVVKPDLVLSTGNRSLTQRVITAASALSCFIMGTLCVLKMSTAVMMTFSLKAVWSMCSREDRGFCSCWMEQQNLCHQLSVCKVCSVVAKSSGVTQMLVFSCLVPEPSAEHLSWCFSWREAASLRPFLTPGHPPNVCSSPPEPALPWWPPRSRSWITFRRRPWSLLGSFYAKQRWWQVFPCR